MLLYRFKLYGENVLLYIDESYLSYEENLDFDLQLLIYNQTSSRFPPNTSFSLIIQDMMIEQWNLSILFDHYYQRCAPSYCTYTEIMHTKNLIKIIITLISMISGLIFVLRLITPLIIKIILRLLKGKENKRQRGN
jgi:hypothetical protein